VDNREPTKGQAKEFWELCGLKVEVEYPRASETVGWGMGSPEYKMPDIGLNNLFKHARPAYIKKYGAVAWSMLLRGWADYMRDNPESDPALTLFHIIQESIHGHS
jgi:hypothetical protein